MAVTVATLRDTLSGYVQSDTEFVPYLNQVLPRLYGMGYWRDLVFEEAITTDHTYFSLPEDSESLLAAVVSDFPSDMRARWQDYKTYGIPSGGPGPVFGVVDDGLHPTIIDLAASTLYQIKVIPVAPKTFLPSEGSVFVTYTRADGSKNIHEFILDGTASMITAEPDATKATAVSEIRFEGVYDKVEVQAVESPATSSSSSSSSSSPSPSSSSSSSPSPSPSPSQQSSSSDSSEYIPVFPSSSSSSLSSSPPPSSSSSPTPPSSSSSSF